MVDDVDQLFVYCLQCVEQVVCFVVVVYFDVVVEIVVCYCVCDVYGCVDWYCDFVGQLQVVVGGDCDGDQVDVGQQVVFDCVVICEGLCDFGFVFVCISCIGVGCLYQLCE